MPDSIKELISHSLQSAPFLAMAPTGGIKLNTQRVMEMVIAASILSYVAYQGLQELKIISEKVLAAQYEMKIDIASVKTDVSTLKKDVDKLKNDFYKPVGSK